MTLSRADTAIVYQQHRAIHEARRWTELADLFAETATYDDPFYGRIEGRDAIRQFLTKAMRGLEAWTFPIEWVVVDEGRVVTHWHNRLPGRRFDGSPFEFPGMSHIAFRDDGKIIHQMDLYDRAKALLVIAQGRSGLVERAVGGVEGLSASLVKVTDWLTVQRSRVSPIGRG
jgi:hypothetical protein